MDTNIKIGLCYFDRMLKKTKLSINCEDCSKLLNIIKIDIQ